MTEWRHRFHLPRDLSRLGLLNIPFWNKMVVGHRSYCVLIPEWYNSMWKLERDADYERRVKQWPKKHRRELRAMHDNLDTFFKALNQGARLDKIQFGFIHNEPKGVKAIDQKGAGAGVKQTRLYIFADTTTKIVHLITIGDKNSQKADIQYAVEFVDNLSTCEGKSDG